MHVSLTSSILLWNTGLIEVDESDTALLFDSLLEAGRIVEHIESRALQLRPAFKIITNHQDDLNLRLCATG